ncbi:SusC/RagA family TonB-linked outer membrane protein [Adhaeribacter rhizoryzae]|nr:TonB-dependent receptor [Adhaeribacter rhizoryzae]
MMKRVLLLLFCLFTVNLLYAQENITVTGKVTDAGTGDPLPGATVQVKGTTSGGVADVSGTYTVSAPANGTLVFSFLGFIDQEIAINNRTTINVALATDAKALEEVVVVGYGVQRKRDLTGSITSVEGESIARQPNVNPLSSLQGKVAGLTVVNSGQAGASPTVRIRGVNSTSNTNPLYVVDGVFQTNIDYLNPADIESMEVLRDPSSIAIFGLQGGNGVIIVTTRRAAKGETRINFQSSVGVQRVSKKIDVADAAGFRRLYNAQLTNLNAAPFDYTNYTGNTNWQDLIFRDALITNNSLSISNSGEKSSTLINLGYNEQEGVVKYNNYKKFVARVNEEIRINQNIKIGGDLTGFHWRQQGAGVGITNALWAAPIVPVQAGENLYYSMPSFQRAQVGNPIASLNRNTGNAVDQGYRVVGSLFAEVKFLKDFTVRSSVYTDLGFNNLRSYSPLANRFVNLGEGTAATDTTYDALVRTSVSQTQQQFRKYQQDHTLTYNKTFKEKHSVTALVGFTTLFNGSTALSGMRRDTTLNIPRDPNFWYLNVADASMPLSNSGSGGEESYMSFLGRINYSFAGKYLVNATFRRDGSSKFSPSNRWGNFGSVGLGWVVSDEGFFQNINPFDFLKLRAAWGTVGSGLGLPANLYLPGLVTSDRAVFGDNVNTSVSPAYVPDPNLHWEVVRGIDVGLDLRALDNRFNAEVTFYDRTTKDILTSLTLPGTAGNYTYRTNLGNISNQGIEVSMGWNDQIGDAFTYSIAPNFSYNKNKVESIGPNLEFEILGNGGVNVTRTGRSIGFFYGYEQVGVYQSTAALDNQPSFTNSLPGDIAYADKNGDGVITPADRTYLGTPFPTWNYGSTFSAGYKGFDALVEIQGVAGNKVYTQRRTATFATLNYETNRLYAWSGPGTSNIEPILDNTRANNYLFSSYFLEPGDYFRFRTVQLGYTFQSERMNKAGIKQLRLSISGQNIATFSRTSGYSPEASLADPIASGADNGSFPVPTIYSFGINASF